MNDTVSGAEAMAGQGGEPPADAGAMGNADLPWYGELDGDLKGWAENKNFKTPADALNSAYNMEKLFGADRAGNTVAIPKEGDADGWNELYGRLGRPTDKAEYKLDPFEGQDENITEWFRGKAHELGLNGDQATQMYNAWNEMVQSGEAELAQQFEAKQAQEEAELKREWGQEYDANLNAGRKAAARFGFQEEELSAMEEAVGYKALMQRMAQIGRAMGEDSFETGQGNNGGFGMTPAAAQQQIGELQINKDFTAAYLDSSHPGHKAAVDKMTRLQKAAYPE